MEILYLWIKSFNGCLNDKEINFGGEYLFKYENDELICSKNKSYRKNFYGNNIENITAIVGENGSGKTSILDYIIRNCTKDFEKVQNEGIFVVSTYESGKKIIYIIVSNNIKLDKSSVKGLDDEFRFEQFKYTRDQYREAEFCSKNLKFQNNTSFIYLSNLFTQPVFKRNNAYQDLTTIGLIQRTNANGFIHSYGEFQNEEMLNQIQFIQSLKHKKTSSKGFSDKLDGFNLKFSSNVTFKIGNIDEHFELATQFADSGLIDSLKIKLASYKKGKKYKMKLVFMFIIQLMYLYGDIKIINDELLKLTNEQDIIQYLNKVTNEYFANERDKADSCIEFSSLVMKISTKNAKEATYSVEIDSDFIKTYIDFTKKWSFIIPVIIIEWTELSTGQVAFLNLFSRFNRLEYVKENVILLIDEGDVFLHPNWQRQVIYLYTEYIAEILEKKHKEGQKLKIQIILTTNNPFMISDLLRENVISLGDSNKAIGDTFGQNIHTMLKNQFFMGSTVGEFFNIRIRELLDKLKSDAIIDIDEAFFLIEQMGDTLLRKKIKMMVYEKIRTDESIADNIELQALITERKNIVSLMGKSGLKLENTLRVLDEKLEILMRSN